MPKKESTKSNTQHPVPQNIMEVEFKIVGDLTMRQFIYVLVFGGLAYATFATGLPGIIKTPIGALLALAGVTFAFVPVEDRGMDEWIANFFKTIYADNQRVWRKEPKIIQAFTRDKISMLQQELITLAPTSSRRKLEEYLRKEEVGAVDPLDYDESEYIEKVHEAFATVETTVELEAPAILAEMPTTIPLTPEKLPDMAESPVEKEITKTATTPKAEIVKTAPATKRKVIKHTPERTTFNPLTPDRHTGRKITSFIKNAGTIILPIRGEKILQAAQQEDLGDSGIDEKTKQLQDLMKQLSTDSNIQMQKASTKPMTEDKKETLQPKVPNTVVGTIRNTLDKGIPNTLLLIKNKHGDPIKAIKTNNLGQFTLNSPLENGQYTIETDVNGATGFTFDIIEIKAKGELIPSIEIKGK